MKAKQVEWEDVTDIREVKGVRITVNELNKISFYQVPKAFHHNPHYIKMNSDSKLAYAILRDLLELSAKNGWVNENGEIYVKLSRQKLMLRLNIKGKQKITKVMKELRDYGLIEEERVGLNKCNKIYVLTPNELNNLYDDSDLLEPIEETPVESNEINEGLKIEPWEVRKSNHREFEKQTHTNTNNTKTNITNISSSSNEQGIVKYFEDNICKLGVSTKKKFLNIIENYSNEYIKAVIDYQSSINTKSYKGFEIAFNNFKSHNIDTVEGLEIFLDNYNKTKVKKKAYAKNNSNYTNNKAKEMMFNDFKQREYDYDDLEKKLLGWDND